MLDYFAFPYYVASVVFMLVDYVILVYDVMLMSYYMFVPNYALCTGAVKYLPDYRFLAFVATVCATAIHVLVSFENTGTCLHNMWTMNFGSYYRLRA